MESRASHDASEAAAGPNLSAQVRSTVGRLYRRFRSERPDGGLGDASLDVLNWLFKNGPQTLTQLSEYGQVAPASMSQSVNRLASAGYIIRTADPSDRRKVLFRATDEGARLALAMRAQRDAWLEARLSELSPQDQHSIAHACSILTKIADA
jgi:DNA-binding MarR family transcriptional regulator